jgi:hypoxanthine phosphoribosyltransferase
MLLKPESIRQVFSAEEVAQRIKELARDVYSYYNGRKEEFWILYLEKGARIFAERLEREIIKLDTRPGSYRGIMSITASRTRGKGFLDEIRLEDFNPQDMEGKNVLLVEDIIDQGVTLAAVIERFRDVVNSYRTCVLVDKTEDRRKSVKLDHVGFQIAEGWVVGLGMDVAEQGRDLAFIGVIDRDYS